MIKAKAAYIASQLALGKNRQDILNSIERTIEEFSGLIEQCSAKGKEEIIIAVGTTKATTSLRTLKPEHPVYHAWFDHDAISYSSFEFNDIVYRIERAFINAGYEVTQVARDHWIVALRISWANPKD